MPTPPTAKIITQPLDSADVVDFAVEATKAGMTTEPFPLLNADEAVASFVVAMTPEAMAAGLMVKDGNGYPSPTLSGQWIIFWLYIDPAKQGSTFFNSPGLMLPIEITVTTTSTPPRIKQRTVVVTVVQQ